jgi:hypothetical protein
VHSITPPRRMSREILRELGFRETKKTKGKTKVGKTKVPGTLKRHMCLPCEALHGRRSFRSPWASVASFPLRSHLHHFQGG